MWRREQIGTAAVAKTEPVWVALWEALASCLARVNIRRKVHALHLEETLGLGDRRMLAIVEWHGEKMLIGVTPQQITLLVPKGTARAESAVENGEKSE